MGEVASQHRRSVYRLAVNATPVSTLPIFADHNSQPLLNAGEFREALKFSARSLWWNKFVPMPLFRCSSARYSKAIGGIEWGTLGGLVAQGSSLLAPATARPRIRIIENGAKGA